MMALSSVNINLFNSKVDPAPVFEDQNEQPFLGGAEKSRVRLGVEKSVFSCESDFIPIIATSTGMPYLQAKSDGSQSVVFGDTDGTPVAVAERDGNTFNIYAAGPTGLTTVAQIVQDGKVLKVFLEGDSESSYTIHKVISHPSRRFQTKHTIKRNGKPVAWTRYGKGNSYVLTVNAGSDVYLMTCLAAIADEVHE